jgi:hypothetical protein
MINEENGEVSQAEWLHDTDLNFKGINKHLNTLADALKQGIAEKKKELAKMVNAQNIVKR